MWCRVGGHGTFQVYKDQRGRARFGRWSDAEVWGCPVQTLWMGVQPLLPYTPLYSPVRPQLPCAALFSPVLPSTAFYSPVLRSTVLYSLPLPSAALYTPLVPSSPL